MENRIKECQLDLYADRTSTATMRANQLRLWLSSMAYVLLCALRRIALRHTRFAKASCGSIRLALTLDPAGDPAGAAQARAGGGLRRVRRARSIDPPATPMTRTSTARSAVEWLATRT